MNYRRIFQNDQVSFGELQVLPLANEYLSDPSKLEGIWVYDDGFVKALIHVEHREILELYVDCFFEESGIGGKLIEFAIHELSADKLLVLEKNERAIRFYERHGFKETGERLPEPGTPEYLIRMCKF